MHNFAASVSYESDTSYILNNVIIGGKSSVNFLYSVGLNIENGANTVIANNVICGNESNNLSIGLKMYGPSSTREAYPKIVNNIIWGNGNSTESFAIYENAITYNEPSELKNNLLFNLNPSSDTYIYKSKNSSNYDDDSPDIELDSELTGLITGDLSGNITFKNTNPINNLEDIFEDPNGTKTPDNYFDDFKPKSIKYSY